MDIRDTVEGDFERILELNDAEVRQTSPMDRERLTLLHGLSSYHRVAVVDGVIAGFLLCMREGSVYDSDNYRWFAERYQRFVYVDRIVVAADSGSRGVGSSLYEGLFEFARQQDVGQICCEYNMEPPNPASRAFHDKFGFREVGTQWLAGGTKRVSLQLATTTRRDR
jgi:uncharacterized protein